METIRLSIFYRNHVAVVFNEKLSSRLVSVKVAGWLRRSWLRLVMDISSTLASAHLPRRRLHPLLRYHDHPSC